MPLATETAIGALEIATSAEATALTDDDKIITPLKINEAVDAWGDENAGAIFDIHELADPGDERILYWVTATNEVTWLDIGNGLTVGGGILQIVNSNINHDALLNFVADEHIAHSSVNLTAGTGLTGGGTIAASRTFNVDISSLPNMAIPTFAATDSILVNNAGVMRQMDLQDMGIKTIVASANQTFALADANSLQLLTGATNRTYTIPDNGAVAFGIGTVIYVGCRDTALLSVSVGAAVTLTSVNGSGVSRIDQVQAGGLAALIKVNTNTWMLSGDLV